MGAGRGLCEWEGAPRFKTLDIKFLSKKNTNVEFKLRRGGRWRQPCARVAGRSDRGFVPEREDPLE